MKIAIILGTRPEIIKMSPIVRACEKLEVEFFILHTGQHWDDEMDKVFFDDLELPQPKYNLRTGGKPYRQQVGILVREMQKIIKEESTDVVLVQGDTHAVICGALAATKMGLPLAHHEAGLRSHDLTMPEEKNRIITDHLSDYLFTPTKDADQNLLEEGIPQSKIWHTGNTVVDAANRNVEIADTKSKALQDLGLENKKFFFITAHRAENVDESERLRGILDGLVLAKKDNPDTELIFSLHPRTKIRMEEFGFEQPEEIRFIKPVGYLDCLMLQKHAQLVITDSGGLQEESSVLQTPCVTIRDNTERPETIQAEINILAGTNAKKIQACIKEMLEKEHDWQPIFGDGTAAEQIVKILQQKHNVQKKL